MYQKHVHTEYVPSTSNGAYPAASKDTIANMLKVPKFFKEEKTASNKKSRKITTARCLTSDEVIQMIEENEHGKEQNRIEKEN